MSPGFCRRCASPLVPGVPEGEDRPRLQCPACGHVEYQNPRVRAGCLTGCGSGTAVLRTVLVQPGERLQSAALRALGASLPEDDLALYCAITDRGAGEVSLVFRSLAGLLGGRGGQEGESVPQWQSALLEQFEADLHRPDVPVYTAEFNGGRLLLAVVERS